MGEESSHSVRDAEEDDRADVPGTWEENYFACTGARLSARGACGDNGERQDGEGGEDGGGFCEYHRTQGRGH